MASHFYRSRANWITGFGSAKFIKLVAILAGSIAMQLSNRHSASSCREQTAAEAVDSSGEQDNASAVIRCLPGICEML